MRGINKVILIGHAGNDAEVNYMPSGGAAANVSLATSESWKDKTTSEMKERTEWHRLSFMDRGNFRLGQIAGDYIKKGSKIYVEGSLRTREWEKDGVKRYTTEVIVNEMQLLDSRQDGQQSNQQQAPSQPNQQGFQQQAPAPKPQPQSFGGDGNGGFAEPQKSVDPWSEYVPAGKAANMTMEQIKSNPSVNGDIQAAVNAGVVARKSAAPSFDDDIPF